MNSARSTPVLVSRFPYLLSCIQEPIAQGATQVEHFSTKTIKNFMSYYNYLLKYLNVGTLVHDLGCLKLVTYCTPPIFFILI